MNYKLTVQQAVSANARMLGIAAPEVEYLPAGCFATPTTRAAAAQSGNGIAINEREFSSADYRVPLRHGDVLTVGTIPLLTEIIR